MQRELTEGRAMLAGNGVALRRERDRADTAEEQLVELKRYLDDDDDDDAWQVRVLSQLSQLGQLG